MLSSSSSSSFSSSSSSSSSSALDLNGASSAKGHRGFESGSAEPPAMQLEPRQLFQKAAFMQAQGRLDEAVKLY